MAKVTRAVRVLEQSGAPFTIHPYEVTEDGDTYGEAVAATLGVAPERLFKTLLAAVDGSPVVAVVPASDRLSLKALARATGGKKATMVPPADAERLTGYVTGGISPFGQRRRLPAVVDRSALDHPTIFCSAGQRGLQVELDPGTVVELLSADLADLTES